MNNRLVILMALAVGAWIVLIAALLLIFATVKVDGQPFYSLIYIDSEGQEWVLDYDLTYEDCRNMPYNPAYPLTVCARQPKEIDNGNS